MKIRILPWILLASILTSPLPASPKNPDTAHQGFEMKPQIIKLEDGREITVDAGRLVVPAARTLETDHTYSLPFYRLRSTAKKPAAPVFLLAGGPGSSWIERFQNEENYAEVAFYQSFADVVLFDQRGGGTSEPEITCPQRRRLDATRPVDVRDLNRQLREMAAECRDHWRAEGFPLEGLITAENASDVDALRRALGYSKITLVGGSYGSHLALHLMFHRPEIVERALLYGIEGPDHTWDDPGAILATLERIAAAAEASTELGPSIPEPGLLYALQTVQDRLAEAPVSVTVRRGEREQEVVVDRYTVQRIARRQASRRSRANAWPEMILDMYDGDFSKVAFGGLAVRSLRLQDPMHYLMDCASGITTERRARYEKDPAAKLLGDINSEYAELCDVWQAPDAGDAFHRPGRSDVPALLIHGTWDISTPIENAREVLETLSNGHLVEVELGNHGALYNLYAHRPESKEWIRAFLTGRPVDLPNTVSLPPVAFQARSIPKHLS